MLRPRAPARCPATWSGHGEHHAAPGRGRCMSAPPSSRGFPRRQARPSIRVAAGVDSCGAGIARLRRPPHPPAQEGPRHRGQPREARGAGHSFFQCWHPGRAAKTRGSALPRGLFPHGCKRRARFGLVDIPQVGPVFPQVGPFLPHGCFSVRGPFSLSSLSFLEEREGGEGAAAGKRASTGRESCDKTCPQVAGGIHGFSVDGCGAGIVVWRGFAPGSGGDPRSTGGNACVPPCFVVSGGAHGADGLV